MTRKARHVDENDPWMLAEEIPDLDIFFFQVPLSCFASNTSYPFLKNYKRVATHYKKFHANFYFDERDSVEIAENCLQALLERPTFGGDLNRNIIVWSDKLMDNARQVAALPLQQLSNGELWKLYKKQDEIHTKLYTYGWFPVGLDMFHNHFTNKLKSYLYGICADKTQAEQAFILLTTPIQQTIIARERKEFLHLYKKYLPLIRKKKLTPEFKTILRRHAEAWGHLGYIYAGNVKPFSVEHYFKELIDLAKTGINADKILKQEITQLKKVKTQQTKLIKKLKINSLFQIQFSTAQGFAITKLYRRHAQLLHLYLMHTTLLVEIAKRLRLTRYQVQFMLMGEVKEALLHDKNYKSILQKRMIECILYTEKNFETIYTGQQAKRLSKRFKKFTDTTLAEFSGQTAQPGYAKGIVKKIFRAKDMGKMNKGDILVSVATDPDIIQAMRKAAAIITEQGGITSHAAIVSRELGIPCVIGTKIATRVLKDGDRVEVDATNGIIRKI